MQKHPPPSHTRTHTHSIVYIHTHTKSFTNVTHVNKSHTVLAARYRSLFFFHVSFEAAIHKHTYTRKHTCRNRGTHKSFNKLLLLCYYILLGISLLNLKVDLCFVTTVYPTATPVPPHSVWNTMRVYSGQQDALYLCSSSCRGTT